MVTEVDSMPIATAPTTVIVLGMHRSGTSCLAGSLEQAGLFLGDVSKSNPHNTKGNQESLAIMYLHEAVLEVNDGRWDHPPEKVVWSKAQQAQRDSIIEGYPADEVWGFKDPRTLFTLEGWLEVLPLARCVGTFRHPLAVAASLYCRDNMPHAQGLDLWLRYNRKLLYYQAQLGFDLICFDWLAARYHERLAHIVSSLQLPQAGHRFTFFDQRLRVAHSLIAEGLSPEINAIYQSLQRIAEYNP